MNAALILDALKAGKQQPVALLSLNPAVDITYEVPRLIADQKVHARSTRYDPGGNSINVARSLKTLGIDAFHLCVTAGDMGTFLRDLLKDQVSSIDYVEAEGETRINGTLMERELGNQYEVSGIGPIIAADSLKSILQRYIEKASAGIGVLTGSTPSSIDEDLYAKLIPQIQRSGGLAFVDSRDEPLRYAMQSKPFLVKPNRFEFEKLLGRKLPTLNDVVSAAEEVYANGIQMVCVSLGQEGLLAATREGVFHARGPEVKVDCTVGAGDSMVAGLVAALSVGLNIREALALAVSCGAGTVQHPGTELFNFEDILDLLPRVTIERL